MTSLSEVALAEIASNFDEGECDWSDSSNLEVLVSVAHSSGVLEDAEVHQLLADDCHVDQFLLSVRISGGVMLCSAPLSWEEVRPPEDSTGTVAIHHVLGRLLEVVEQLKEDLSAYAWIRVSKELAAVRGIIAGHVAVANGSNG